MAAILQQLGSGHQGKRYGSFAGRSVTRFGDIIVATVTSLVPRYTVEAVGMPKTVESLVPRYTVETI